MTIKCLECGQEFVRSEPENKKLTGQYLFTNGGAVTLQEVCDDCAKEAVSDDGMVIHCLSPMEVFQLTLMPTEDRRKIYNAQPS